MRQLPENDENKKPETKGEHAEKRAASAFMSDQRLTDCESYNERQLEAESKEQTSRQLSPEEAAVLAKRGAKVVGDATKALGFSLGIENGKSNVILPGRTPDQVKFLAQAEKGEKENLPFNPDELQCMAASAVSKQLMPSRPQRVHQAKALTIASAPNDGDLSVKPDVIAQDVEVPMKLPTPLLSPQDFGITSETIGHLFKAARNLEQSIKHPFRNHISESLSEIPATKWNEAYAAFPQFKAAHLSEKQVIELMQGIVRNELFFYDFADAQDDRSVRDTGKPMGSPFPIGPQRKADDATLGFSQVSPGGINKFEKEYPDQMSQYSGKEKESLLEPSQAPMMVAAVLCHTLEMYERHHLPISEKSLAYGFNPDVVEGGKKQTLPTANTLAKSEHVANVMRQVGIIRNQIDPKFDEL